MTELLVKTKSRKVVLFCLNLLLIGPYLIAHIADAYTLPLVIASLCFAAWRIVWKSPEARPACGGVAQLFFLDFYLALLVNYRLIGEAIDGEAMGDNISYLIQLLFENPHPLMLVVIASVLAIVARKRESRFWLLSFAGASVGLALLMCVWTNCDLLHLSYEDGGRAILALYCIGALIWGVLSEVSLAMTDYELRRQNYWMGLTMLVSIVFVLCASFSFVNQAAPGWANWLFALPTRTLSWGRTVVLCLVLLACSVHAVIVSDASEEGKYPDAAFLLFAAVDAFILRVLLSNYFPWSWVVMIVVMASEVLALYKKRDESDFTYWLAYVVIIVPIAILVTVLMHNGLGLFIPVSVVALYAVTTLYKPADVSLLTLLAKGVFVVACEVLAWQVCRRFSVDSLIITLMVAGLSLMTFRILARVHPSGTAVDTKLLAIVGAVTLLLCVFSLRTTVKLNMSVDGNSVAVSAEAKRGGEIESVSYCWRNAFGQAAEDVSTKTAWQGKDTVRSEVLTIEVVDTHGAHATYYYFFPPWLYSLDGNA